MLKYKTVLNKKLQDKSDRTLNQIKKREKSLLAMEEDLKLMGVELDDNNDLVSDNFKLGMDLLYDFPFFKRTNDNIKTK